jgi:putative acetyltransferase
VEKIKIEIKPSKITDDFQTVLKLIKDYHNWLKMNLSYQHLDDELNNLAAIYNLPRGCFLLAWVNCELAGGVGLRKWDDQHGEMKRLFVYPQYRGMNLGKKLCIQILSVAQQIGYDYVRLDTVGKLEKANRLYDKLGFYEIKPYCPNPDPTARFLEIKLI